MANVPAGVPRIGLAVATIGRAELAQLLDSAAASSVLPYAVAIGNQSGTVLPIDPEAYPFTVVVVTSSGGASRGRNDAVRALPDDVDVIGFPNDDSFFPPVSLAKISHAFADNHIQALAGSLTEFEVTRFTLPPAGTLLDPLTSWRAIEQTSYIRSATFRTLGGFREDLGTGSPTLWQSGEITDLLLRVLEAGGSILSRPDIVIHGRGEQRDLSVAALIAKHRRYARGTGYVYRIHAYSTLMRLRTVAGPWLHPFEHHPNRGVSLRLAVARSLGRVEGLLGRAMFGGGADPSL